MTHLGAAQGSPETAKRLLAAGELICLAPGGMREALRPSSKRYRIEWENRKGFVRLAVEHQVPIILAACPKADDLYKVYSSRITKAFYDTFKVPVFFARGLGLTPIPRPVKLVHYMSKPLMPPKLLPGEDFDACVGRFHALILRKMKQLMATN